MYNNALTWNSFVQNNIVAVVSSDKQNSFSSLFCIQLCKLSFTDEKILNFIFLYVPSLDFTVKFYLSIVSLCFGRIFLHSGMSSSLKDLSIIDRKVRLRPISLGTSL